MSAHIHVIHENNEWSQPLFDALDELGVPYRDWFIHERSFDLSAIPPTGVFYNRMSASSHTRGHRFSGELTGAVLSWLESHSRRTVNGVRALQLELSKAAQYAALRARGIATPRTFAVVGPSAALEASRAFPGRFIVKHNRGGKGLGVRLLDSTSAFGAYLASEDYDAPVDGITLVQEYIEPASPEITRLEFVGNGFLYAVRVDTSDGFELCPADNCEASDELCPASNTATARERFRIEPSFEDPLVPRILGFLKANEIEVAAVEVIEDRAGRKFVYDVNTNTNYNQPAESRAGVHGMRALAEFLRHELEVAVREADRDLAVTGASSG